MKYISSVAILCAMGLASSASAQNVSEDVRCFLLSNGFAKAAPDEKAKKIATASVSFYLGRLEGKASSSVINAALVKEGTSIDPKTAGPQMTACATKMVRAEQAMRALLTPLAAKK